MSPVDGIQPGSAPNHIKFVCDNGTLSLFANGNPVATTTDTTFTSGDVGLRIGTYAEAGLEIVFDNFVVLRP
jgi:hypothetical protein